MLFQALFLSSLAAAAQYPTRAGVKNLIVFGDSYTDEGRLQYLIEHGGATPPPGTVIPASNATAGGGNSWPYYASKQLGATTYNYAVAGAVCSNEIVYRYLDALGGPFPSVVDYEVPAFQADVKYASTTPNATIFEDRTAENSVYALWIGTNDLGSGGFLLDQQVPGKTISDYVDCVWSVFDSVYEAGGRRFALFAQAPLELSPLYASLENGGAGDVNYWSNKTAYNTTETEFEILEYTTTVNTIYDYSVPFQLRDQKRWPGASFVLLDTHQIILDIHNSPEKYLDSPANVTGWYYTCPDPLTTDGCANSEHPLSSFLWYDTLHPSARADEIIGLELAKALTGSSSYATYY